MYYRSALLIALLISSGSAVIAESHQDDAPIQFEATGEGVRAQAGRKFADLEVEDWSRIVFRYDLSDIWTALSVDWPSRLHPENNGQDVANNNYGEPTIGRVIFEYGQRPCAGQILAMAGFNLEESRGFDGALESVEATAKAFTFVLSFIGIAIAEAAEVAVEISFIAVESEGPDDFKKRLLYWSLGTSGKKFVEKYGNDLEDMFKTVFDKGVDLVVDEFAALLSSEPVEVKFKEHSYICEGPLNYTFQMFVDDPRVPRASKPASAVLTIKGDCYGNSGRYTNIGEFLLIAEYEVRPQSPQPGVIFDTIVMKPTNPQFFIDANCSYNPDSYVIEAAPEKVDTGPDRPIWVGDEIIAFGDWRAADAAYYRRVQDEYDAWYLARHRYRWLSERINELNAALRVYRRTEETERESDTGASDVYERAVERKQAAESQLEAMLADLEAQEASTRLKGDTLVAKLESFPCYDSAFCERLGAYLKSAGAL